MKPTNELTNRLTVFFEQKPCYDIVFSKDFSDIVNELAKLDIKNKRLCIVTDSNVGPIYAEELKNIIKPHCKQIIIHQFHAGEEYKNVATVNSIYEVLIQNRFDRNDMLLALGGGVAGDITGFAAATYLRGIDFVQIPTSLLSQVDSSIGGKTGVDFESYKNMVGAFYMPRLVYMNLSTLNTLPMREYLSGMGEIIKHGLIKDADYYQWILDNTDGIKSKEYDVLKQMIFESCNIKKEVVENDPKEKGERALLNFGHTMGHAVEKLKDFSLLHGECVSIGISAAAYISMHLGNISFDEYQNIREVLSAFQLPICTDNLNAEDIVTATLNDKKMDSGIIKFIILTKIGNAQIDRNITKDMLLDAAQSIIIR